MVTPVLRTIISLVASRAQRKDPVEFTVNVQTQFFARSLFQWLGVLHVSRVVYKDVQLAEIFNHLGHVRTGLRKCLGHIPAQSSSSSGNQGDLFF